MSKKFFLERVAGIEPASSAWKAEVIAIIRHPHKIMVEGAGFEPAKAEPSDLQSDPFGHSGTPPRTVASIILKVFCFATLYFSVLPSPLKRSLY